MGYLKKILPKKYFLLGILFFYILSLILLMPNGLLMAQEESAVQIINGNIKSSEFVVYHLAGLKKDQILYINIRGTSGNLDPWIGLIEADADFIAIRDKYFDKLKRSIDAGKDPIITTMEALDDIFLKWDDDSGEGLSAVFSYFIPKDGDYALITSGAYSSLGRITSGNYKLLIGIDAPEVLGGNVTPIGDTIAQLDREKFPPEAVIQEKNGILTKNSLIMQLKPLIVKDKLYVFVESISGDLKPALVLLNYADKPLQTSNINGSNNSATIEYSFDQEVDGYKLELTGIGVGDEDSKYRMLLGLNTPEVLSGNAEPTGNPIVEESISVEIGLQLLQIVKIEQENQRFTVVADILMEWDDPQLAFNPDSCDCVTKVYTKENIDSLIEEAEGRWPDFSIYNQQANRWTQNRVAVIKQDGHVLYFERFSTDLHAHFYFEKYPFDIQDFNIIVDMIYPEEFYHFIEMKGYSEISPFHGEDEFIITGAFDTEITSEQARPDAITSRFTFHFAAPRHFEYYLLQIFAPILLISAVSWFSFFLRDYLQRVTVSSANLLLFVAFSFSLASDYPRLGYLTLLDTIMVFVFIINAIIVLYNIVLRRMEINGRIGIVLKIDKYLDWVFPAFYIAFSFMLYMIYFR